MHPSISVVIPCYNAEKTIIRCLQSILSQTVAVSEIFVIDDFSQDQSVRLVKSFFSNYDGPVSCRLITQSKNQGPSFARNCGIAAANGEFIALIDSDDYWLSTHVETNLSVISKFDSGSVAIVHQPLVEDDVAVSEAKAHLAIKFQKFSLVYYLFIQKNCSTITMIAPRGLVQRCKFPESQKHAEDFRFFIRLFSSVEYRAFLVAPRTAVMGKHAYASGQGLSSQRGRMLFGVLQSLVTELACTKYMPLLIILIPWHLLKAVRREFLYVCTIKTNKMGSRRQ
jgi:glycosyltransferase involved in cell wall biosynthesis